MSDEQLPSPADPWRALRKFTTARIALGRAGMSQPTSAQLAFQLDHARARDAVTTPLDIDSLQQALEPLGLPILRLHSQAPDRTTYLQRPDLGRLLDDRSLHQLAAHAPPQPPDIALVIADGLSAAAIATQAPPFLALLLPALRQHQYTPSPLCLVEQGRVAVADHIGHHLHARMALILIGERPGLSSPHSMGLYFSYAPRPGLTDADRNCISNIHAAGLPYPTALRRLLYLITHADRLQRSGVGLKENADQPATLPTDHPARNFLLD